MSKFRRFNDHLAETGTRLFGSMPAFYLFFTWGILGLIPWFPARFTNVVLLISSAWIQLWALPLIAVGSAVLGRAGERRSIEDHKMIRQEFELLKSELQEIKDLHRDLKALISRLKLE